MKKIGEYTTRGILSTADVSTRVILDDGSFKTGYRVVEFRMGPHDMDNTGVNYITGKLMTVEDSSVGRNWNWEKNEEIGWSVYCHDANSNANPSYFNLVDPDNLVIQDLYIVADEGSGGTIKANYFIRMEKYEISDWQGALGMVRNRSQA